jgi:hypothetical protein
MIKQYTFRLVFFLEGRKGKKVKSSAQIEELYIFLSSAKKKTMFC